MNRLLAVCLGIVMTGCASSPAEVKRVAPKPELLVGVWRSVTPSYEFVRLAVYVTSSRSDEVGAHLTLSGTAWDGTGKVDADSVVTTMSLSGQSVATGEMTVRGHDGASLEAHLRPLSGTAVSLSFVRE